MKLKLGFRRAIDSGKKSGGRRMVGALFNECYEIWSGSPAVEALNIGLETSMINERSEDTSSLENEDSPCRHRSEAQSTHEEDGASCDSLVESIKNKMKRRRHDLLESLEERLLAKCTKQVSVQKQMVSLVNEESALRKEDIELRKRSLEQFKAAEISFNASLQQISQEMSRTINQGFMMMASMFQQHQHHHQHQQYQHQEQEVQRQFFVPDNQQGHQNQDQGSIYKSYNRL